MILASTIAYSQTPERYEIKIHTPHNFIVPIYPTNSTVGFLQFQLFLYPSLNLSFFWNHLFNYLFLHWHSANPFLKNSSALMSFSQPLLVDFKSSAKLTCLQRLETNCHLQERRSLLMLSATRTICTGFRMLHGSTLQSSVAMYLFLLHTGQIFESFQSVFWLILFPIQNILWLQKGN